MFLALYFLYGLGNVGMTGLLFSFAVGLIISSFDYAIELVAAGVIISGLLWGQVMNRRREGFTNRENVPTGRGQDAQSIVKKIEEITRRNVFQPSGVLSSNFAEGFANPDDTTAPLPDSGSNNAKPAGSTTPPPSNSTAAPVNSATATPNLAASLPTANAAAATTPPAQNPPPAAPAGNPQPSTSGFADKNQDGMFKLGSIPADAVGGSHIDVGTTLMNALNSLKPDQVKAMTEDTRKLMETQKSLMGMLGSMKPMLQDGKQMMDTFQEMFGGMK